jgi:PAP2 superfamily
MTWQCWLYGRDFPRSAVGRKEAIQMNHTDVIGASGTRGPGTKTPIVERPRSAAAFPASQGGFVDLDHDRVADVLRVLRTGILRMQEIDESLLRVARTRCHAPAFEGAVVRFSRLGEHSRLWMSIALAGAARDRKHRRLYLRLLGTLIATEVANALVKLAVDRPRPMLPGLSPLMSTRSDRSFPSAHASTSFAATRLLTRALPSAPVYMTAGAMALSRPYLGVHYPSDVLGGVALGIVLGEIAGS